MLYLFIKYFKPIIKPLSSGYLKYDNQVPCHTLSCRMQSNLSTYLKDEAFLADYVDSPTRDFVVSVLEKLLHPLTPPERFEFTVRCRGRPGATVFVVMEILNRKYNVCFVHCHKNRGSLSWIIRASTPVTRNCWWACSTYWIGNNHLKFYSWRIVMAQHWFTLQQTWDIQKWREARWTPCLRNKGQFCCRFWTDQVVQEFTGQ